MNRPMTVGERLKEARMIRHMSIIEAQQISKVQKKYIEAIEADDYDQLPNDFYARAFIRQYAHAIGEDAEKMIKLYNGEPIDETIEQEMIVESRFSPVTDQRRHQQKAGVSKQIPMIFLALVALLILGTVFYVTFATYHSNQSAIDTQKSFVVNGSDSEEESTSTTESATDESSTTTSSSEEAPSDTTISQDPPQNNLMTVNISKVSYPITLKLTTGSDIRVKYDGFYATDTTGILMGSGYLEPKADKTFTVDEEQIKTTHKFFLHLQVYNPKTMLLQPMQEKNVSLTLNDQKIDLENVSQIAMQGSTLTFNVATDDTSEGDN